MSRTLRYFPRRAWFTRAVAAGAVVASAGVLLAACTDEPTARPGSPGSSDLSTAGEAPEIVADLRPVEPLVDRAAHTASLLPGGRVLVVGGCVVDGCSKATDRTELFDPATQRFIPGPRMLQPRAGHTATSLPNGDVLILGGYTGEGTRPLAAAELYVASTRSFVPAGEMAIGRGAQAAALLDDGRVLVAGGWLGGSFTEAVELWDPRTRRFSAAQALPAARGSATATRLADGRVLVAGGETTQGTGLGTVEIYDPANDVWEEGPSLTYPRLKHAAVALASGDVLILGGTPDDRELIDAVELYDGNSFREAGTLNEGRYKLVDAVVALPDGRVLLAGGGETAEAYDPTTETAQTIAETRRPRSSFATATLLESGGVLVIGGYDHAIDLRRDAFVIGVRAAA